MKMKTLFLLPILLLSLLSTSCWSLDWGDLSFGSVDRSAVIYRDGYFYKRFTDTPFTGKVTGSENGRINNGKRKGEWVWYYPDGRLHHKGNYKNGKKEGEWFTYWTNGKLFRKGSYKNDEKEGEWARNSDNDFYSVIETYKNGKKISERPKR